MNHLLRSGAFILFTAGCGQQVLKSYTPSPSLPPCTLSLLSDEKTPTACTFIKQTVEKQNAEGQTRYIWFPEFHRTGLYGQDLARAFLAENKEKWSFPPLEELKLQRVQKSLLGVHMTFQQMSQGYEVYGSQVVLSLSLDQSDIYFMYNSSVGEPAPIFEEPESPMPVASAYDIAWQDLKVQGDLTGRPHHKTVLWPSKNGSVIGYQISLPIKDPQGAWQYVIDQSSGKILSKKNLQLSKNLIREIPSSSQKILNRQDAFARFFEKEKRKALFSKTKALERRTGQALIFDPNPVIALENVNLRQDSNPEEFEAAYEIKPLKDLAFDGRFYHLDGPWIKIVDFEEPYTQPSVTENGFWNWKRDSPAFHDAMTYYHIDQTQRYIQSLGFLNDRGILNRPIEVDSDGVDGADNSYYSPMERTLSFGHGCVADNEDSDVIMHEYGHAIEHEIVDLWGGADSGAIGEGFGDYWATSYRYRGAHKDFQTFQMFGWDRGGGDCWPGRRTDKLNALYERDKTYEAHGRDSDFIHDELWSTPLVQAMVWLVNSGIPKEDVDRIILQAHFGLSQGVTMEDMALSTLIAAKMLYPSGMHAQAFAKSFMRHKLLPSLQN